MKAGIVGYGNLATGIEAAIAQAEDIELVGVFSRRDPSSFETISKVPAYDVKDILDFKDTIDILFMFS